MAMRGDRSGFTLVELLVVIAILGVMLGLIGMGAKPVSPATHARERRAGNRRARLRLARSTALMKNRSIAFTLDLATPAYQWGAQPAHVLPPDVKLAVDDGARTGRVGYARSHPFRSRWRQHGRAGLDQIGGAATGSGWSASTGSPRRVSVVHSALISVPAPAALR